MFEEERARKFFLGIESKTGAGKKISGEEEVGVEATRQRFARSNRLRAWYPADRNVISLIADGPHHCHPASGHYS